MTRLRQFAVQFALAGLAGSSAAGASTVDVSYTALNSSALGGSPSSMERQHEIAVEQDYDFLETPAEVREYVEQGQLERVTESEDFALAGVTFPYARPEVRMFIERLAAKYHAATGEPLVITSLTRPIALQPANAHALSVHPAGMAVDFRVPARAKARVWLEKTLLELEHTGVVDVTREHTPPHYHVAVFAASYRAFAEPMVVTAARDSSASAVSSTALAAASPSSSSVALSQDTTRGVAPLALLFIAAVAGALLGFTTNPFSLARA